MRYQKADETGDETARKALADEADSLLKDRPEDVLLLGIALDQAGRTNDMDRAGTLVRKLLELQPDNRLRYRQQLALLMEKGDMAGHAMGGCGFW